MPLRQMSVRSVLHVTGFDTRKFVLQRIPLLGTGDDILVDPIPDFLHASQETIRLVPTQVMDAAPKRRPVLPWDQGRAGSFDVVEVASVPRRQILVEGRLFAAGIVCAWVFGGGFATIVAVDMSEISGGAIEHIPNYSGVYLIRCAAPRGPQTRLSELLSADPANPSTLVVSEPLPYDDDYASLLWNLFEIRSSPVTRPSDWRAFMRRHDLRLLPLDDSVLRVPVIAPGNYLYDEPMSDEHKALVEQRLGPEAPKLDVPIAAPRPDAGKGTGTRGDEEKAKPADDGRRNDRDGKDGRGDAPKTKAKGKVADKAKDEAEKPVRKAKQDDAPASTDTNVSRPRNVVIGPDGKEYDISENPDEKSVEALPEPPAVRIELSADEVAPDEPLRIDELLRCPGSKLESIMRGWGYRHSRDGQSRWEKDMPRLGGGISVNIGIGRTAEALRLSGRTFPEIDMDGTVLYQIQIRSDESRSLMAKDILASMLSTIEMATVQIEGSGRDWFQVIHLSNSRRFVMFAYDRSGDGKYAITIMVLSQGAMRGSLPAPLDQPGSLIVRIRNQVVSQGLV